MGRADHLPSRSDERNRVVEVVAVSLDHQKEDEILELRGLLADGVGRPAGDRLYNVLAYETVVVESKL